jgi:parvulin-like peptidyl-prolyl isomerase
MNAKRWAALGLVLVVVAALMTCCGSTPEPTAAPTPTTGAVVDPTERAAQSQIPTVEPQPTAAIGVEAALSYIPRLEGEVLATVNGQDVTWEEYEPLLLQALSVVVQNYNIDWSDPAMQQRLQDLQADALEEMVNRKLLEQMAEEQNLLPSDEDLEAELEVAKAEILGSGQYASWEAFLEQFRLTDELFRQMYRNTLLMRKLMAEQDVATSEEQVELAHIAVSDEGVALAVVQELKAGRDFADLAAQYSEDAETKDKGGELGWFSRGGMPPEIEQAAFSLRPGEFSDPIEQTGGYVIILVLAREMRDLDDNMLQAKQLEAIMVQVEALRAEADIEYLVDLTTGRD